MTDREFVERHWAQVMAEKEWSVTDNGLTGKRRCVSSRFKGWSIRILIGSSWINRLGREDKQTEDEAWSAAAEFTRKRLAEIFTGEAALREVTTLRDRWGEVPQWTWLHDLTTQRLAELKQGMK